MPVRRVDHVELDILAERAQRRGELLGTDGGYSQSELNAMSSVLAETVASASRERAAAVLPGEVEVGQRARRVEIGVRVEALDERVGLVAQVALDLELRLGQGVADVVGELQPPAELVAERLRRQIRDVADHARDAHAGVRRAAGAVVVAALPVGIGHDRVARDRIPGDALRLKRVRAGDRHDRVDLIADTGRPTRAPACRRAIRRRPRQAASMPSSSRNARSVRTMSATVITGKSDP